MNKTHTPYLGLIFAFFFMVACQNQPPTQTAHALTDSGTKTFQNFTFHTISAPNNTFGYAIFVDGKKLIHQDNIPAVAGIDGFKSAEKAEKVAQFLIEKMKQGDKLPAISPDELKQLGVL